MTSDAVESTIAAQLEATKPRRTPMKKAKPAKERAKKPCLPRSFPLMRGR